MSLTSARHFAGQVLLWAAPLGVGLALILLLASAPFFRTGPETPSAGDSQAWGAMWGAFARGDVVTLRVRWSGPAPC